MLTIPDGPKDVFGVLGLLGFQQGMPANDPIRARVEAVVHEFFSAAILRAGGSPFGSAATQEYGSTAMALLFATHARTSGEKASRAWALRQVNTLLGANDGGVCVIEGLAGAESREDGSQHETPVYGGIDDGQEATLLRSAFLLAALAGM